MAGFNQGWFEVEVTAGDGSGVISSTVNPEGVDVYITRALFVIDEASTGASTLDIGVDADDDTSDDRLFDGLSGASTGVFDNHNDTHNGTNGLTSLTWAAGEYLTVAEASGDVTGLEGRLLIEYKRVGLES